MLENLKSVDGDALGTHRIQLGSFVEETCLEKYWRKQACFLSIYSFILRGLV